MIQSTEDKILYFCVGCRQVHLDNDYCKKDGDLTIMNWDNLLESIETIKREHGVNATDNAEDKDGK